MNDISIKFEKLTKQNFSKYSLDTFVRHQDVTHCWRNVDGEWKLLPIAFTEEWDLKECRRIAKNISENLDKNLTGYGAFMNGTVIGYITIGTSLFGSRRQYIQLAEFEVSEKFRGQKIGKRLFELGCDAARSQNAEKLYISAHSSKESQAAYKALGCVHAMEINAKLAEEEPCDVKMEYVLANPLRTDDFGSN